MKNFLVAILSLIYITTSSGIVINLHYCMGEVSAYRQGIANSGICKTCGMKGSDQQYNDCCKDEQKFLKNTSDQKVTESSYDRLQNGVVGLPVRFIEISYNFIYSFVPGIRIGHSPPRSQSVARYLRNCDFRI